MQSKLVFPGGAHASRGIAAVRVRPRCAAPRAGAEVYPAEADDNVFRETSSVADATSSQIPAAGDSAGFDVVANRLERSVADEVTEGMRNCSEDDFRPSPPASSFDPVPLGSTLISGPMVAVRHKVMDSAAAAHELSPTQTSASTASLEVAEASQAGSITSDEVQPVSTVDTPKAIPVTIKTAPELAAPVATSAPQRAAVESTPSTPVRVRSVSDTFTTGGKPSPGNRDSFITGQPSPANTSSPRPYLASNPTDPRGYPAFKFDEAAASQYSSAAQSIPMRPNYESRYPSRSSNCDSPPPPLADALSSSKSVGMPSDTYGYRRLPQEALPGYGYSRASGPQQQAPQRPYQYRLPPDYAPSGGPLPLSPPSARSHPPQGYGTPNDPWDIFESGSAIGHSQGLLHIDGGVYGGGGGGYGGYSNSAPSYGGPSSSYGYGGGGGYSAPAPPPPPPPPSYQYGGYGNGGGGGAYGQQSQYYAPPPPSQYGGGAAQPGGSYRGAPPPQADPGQFYGGNYSAPASPRRAAPQPEPNYTYKARAPAGNMPEENLSSYAYGNSYNGGTGFGSGGNYGGQTAYGSPVPGNYPGGGQQEEASYPGIELLSPGYPEFERHARQSGGNGGGARNSAGELRYPGIEGGAANMQQRAVAPAGVTEYSDRMTPPAYGSSYTGFTAPSAYEPPPPDAYAQYQQVPPGGYYGMPPPAPPPEAQYGYRGYPGAGGGYAGPAQGYPQRPMGFSSPEEGGPIAVRQPRIMVSKEIQQGDQLMQIRGDIGTAPHGIVETVLPFAALPEASNVAMLAAANAPGPEPTLHFGVLAAALCCVIAASAGVTVPQTGAREQE